MNYQKYLYMYMFGVFTCLIETIRTENKTSSECWGCNPNTPHVLSCTGSSVIVIQGSSYGYNGDCSVGITGGGCSGGERNRCCTPGDPSSNCLDPFNVTDRQDLERTCSSKSTCTFNSIRHSQSYTCSRITFDTNSFTLINYICQTPGSITVSTVPITSSTKTPIDTTTQYDTASSRTPASKVTLPSDDGKEMSSSDGKVTSGKIGGIVVGVIAIIILLCIAAFLLYQRHEKTKPTKNRQQESNRQQSTTRTVGVQHRETDFTDITTSPNITTSSSDTSYSQLNRLGSQPVQYDDLIMNNNDRNSTTDNNYNSYYNQQYVNM